MNTSTLLLVAGAAAVALIAMRSKPRAMAAQTTSGAYTGLNSGIYNPLYNPGGSTNYSASFAGLQPATGYGPYISFKNAPGILLPTAIR